MDCTVVDDRNITHTESRHFAHALALRYLKRKLTVDAGVKVTHK